MKRLLAAVSILTTLTAFAPRAERPTDEERLVLIHTLIGEAGWRKARDHAAIMHVLDRRRRLPVFAEEDLSLAEMALRYSKFHSPHKELNKHRAQVKDVTLESAPPWAHEAVDRFYAGTLPDPCRGRAMHWGSSQDYEGRQGENVVDCGKTYNIFTR